MSSNYFHVLLKMSSTFISAVAANEAVAMSKLQKPPDTGSNRAVGIPDEANASKIAVLPAPVLPYSNAYIWLLLVMLSLLQPIDFANTNAK
jgi:hypothetical protein